MAAEAFSELALQPWLCGAAKYGCPEGGEDPWKMMMVKHFQRLGGLGG